MPRTVSNDEPSLTVEERPFKGRVTDPEKRTGLQAQPPYFFRLNNGNPQAPIAIRAPNKITASILARPCGAQYTSSRLSHSANSSSVSAAPTPYKIAINRLSSTDESSVPTPISHNHP